MEVFDHHDINDLIYPEDMTKMFSKIPLDMFNKTQFKEILHLQFFQSYFDKGVFYFEQFEWAV